MAIIKLKPQQTFSCSFCKDIGLKVPAKYRMFMSVKHSCEEHKQMLIDYENKYFEREWSEDYSEADQQTWLKV